MACLGVTQGRADVGQGHVLLAGARAQAGRANALRGRREGDVLFLVPNWRSLPCADLGAFPLSRRWSPVSEELRRPVYGSSSREQKHAFAGNWSLLGSNRGWARGRARPQTLKVARAWGSRRRGRAGIRQGAPSHGGPEGLGRVGTGRVVVDEGCVVPLGALAGLLRRSPTGRSGDTGFLWRRRPRRKVAAKHGGAKSGLSAPMMESSLWVHSFVEYGIWHRIGR